jgi:hypothetical protein
MIQRLRSGIRKKLRTFASYELPLLSRQGLLQISPNRSTYHYPVKLAEPWPGLENESPSENSSIGKAKVPGPIPGQVSPSTSFYITTIRVAWNSI